MVQICNVQEERVWEALSHCALPVRLAEAAGRGDFRELSPRQREGILFCPPGRSARLALWFEDGRDYARFVLADLTGKGGGA